MIKLNKYGRRDSLTKVNEIYSHHWVYGLSLEADRYSYKKCKVLSWNK